MTALAKSSRLRGRVWRAAGRGRCLAWLLALLAVQVLALLGPPARAHAGAWIEVCSAAGVKRLPAEPGSRATHEDHCPLCRVADATVGPPHIERPGGAIEPLGIVRRLADPPAVGATPLHDAPPRAPPAR